MIQQKSRRLLALSIYAFLVASTIVAYEPLRHNDFVSYDDYSYITQNPHVTGGLTLKSIKWAFTESHFHMWHPLTSVSHMLDCELFGLDPFWHHLVSLLLHMASSCLLFQILQKMTGRPWQSAFVAAVFALHPLNVESVAWAAERKSALSCVLWMSTILVYVRYVERPRITRYLPVVLSFCLAGMAKPMVVTLPFVLLLLDYWPLERFQSASQRKNETPKQRGLLRTHWLKSRFAFLIKEKIPLFILSVVLSVITFVVQRGGKVVATTEMLPVGWRVANAVVSYVRYMTKMAYPYRLAPLYPHPAASLPSWQVVVCLLTLLAISVVVLVARRQRRYLVVGWLWYVGTLVPVIGLVQVGSQAIADRYIYLPMVGILIIVAWGAADLAGRWWAARLCLILSSGALLTALLLGTRTQVKYWSSSLMLFAHAIEVTENNAIMHNSYACALYDEGRLDEALVHLCQAVRISPKFALSHTNLGRVLLKQRKVNEAVGCFEQALKRGQEQPEVHYYLGQCYDYLEDNARAISSYRQALRLKPDYAEAHYRLALVLSDEKELNDAVRHLSNALGVRPNWAAAHVKIGHVYLQLREYEKVVSHWSTAVTLQPDDAENLNNLAWMLAAKKDARIRNPDRALSLAKQACELTHYEDAAVLDTLAVCYAAVGEFDRAAESAATAISIAEATGMKDLAQQIEDRRRLYQAGQPYRER